MNKKLSERLSVLEEMGFDTSKYNVVINGSQVEITGVKEIADRVVEDKQVENKAFRRWITAQTFKMLYTRVYDWNARDYVTGWDACLRNRYDYKYQFSMMKGEIEDLIKLSYKDKAEYEVRKHFFTPYVVKSTCEHYVKQLIKYVNSNAEYVRYKNGDIDRGASTIKLANYGTINLSRFDVIVFCLNEMVKEMDTDDYKVLLVAYNKFMGAMNKLPYGTPKCPAWKDAFKGAGAYYSLQNMVLYHGCILRGCANKQESLDKLKLCLKVYEGYQFHALLKDTIEYNNFNLGQSIARNK